MKNTKKVVFLHEHTHSETFTPLVCYVCRIIDDALLKVMLAIP